MPHIDSDSISDYLCLFFKKPQQRILFSTVRKMSNNQMKDSNSDVSELDPKELSEVVLDQYAVQLGYAEDPEASLTADSFPSKSGGRPVLYYKSAVKVCHYLFIIVDLVKSGTCFIYGKSYLW
jgi:hypothetical protein